MLVGNMYNSCIVPSFFLVCFDFYVLVFNHYIFCISYISSVF